MKTKMSSARAGVGIQAGVLLLVLAGTLAGVAGCGGDSSPSCNGCNINSNPTPFTPGDLPGSAESLQGGRCAATGSQLTIFGNQLLATDLANHTAMSLSFMTNQGFVVYWSVCNVGAGRSDAVSAPQGLHISGPGGENETFSFSIPALESCACVVPIPQHQFTSGLATPGSYALNLIGMFSTTATLTIN
jgi:hypothetical protein